MDSKNYWISFKNNWLLYLVFLLVFIFVAYWFIAYSIDNPLLPFILVSLFLFMKIFEYHFKKDIDSKKAKGVCYFGLGCVGLLDAIGTLNPINHMNASVYAATMCFMECIDSWFDRKCIEESDSKEHSEGLDKVQNKRLRKANARIAKSNKKA